MLRGPGAGSRPTTLSDRREFLEACSRGEHSRVEELLSDDPALVNCFADGWFPLLCATSSTNCDLALVQLLLAKGARVEARDNAGLTALHQAASEGCEDVVALLLQSGARASTADASGSTPLMLSAEKGHVGVVRLLLQRAPHSVDARDGRGTTALWRAASNGQSEAVSVLLLEGGAEPGVRDRRRRRAAVEVAAEKGHGDVTQVLQWFESELDRPYHLHRARSVWQDWHNHELYPSSPPPPHLAARAAMGQPLSSLEVVVGQDATAAVRCGGGGKRPRWCPASEGGAGEEEVGATLVHVVGDLAPELFVELMDGITP